MAFNTTNSVERSALPKHVRRHLQDFGSEAIYTRPFPIETTDSRGSERSHGGSREHGGHVMCSDMDKRHAYQRGADKEGQSTPPHAVEHVLRLRSEPWLLSPANPRPHRET